MSQIFVNNAFSKLAAPLAPGETLLELESGLGFPAVVAPDFLLVTLADEHETRWEIVRVVAHDAGSAQLQVLRGQEHTADQDWEAGDRVEARLTAGSLYGIQSLADLADSVSELALAIRRAHNSMPIPDPAGRLRTLVDGGSLSSLGSLANVNGFGGYSTTALPFALMQSAAATLRSKIELT